MKNMKDEDSGNWKRAHAKTQGRSSSLQQGLLLREDQNSAIKHLKKFKRSK